jgi:hypothetical protein
MDKDQQISTLFTVLMLVILLVLVVLVPGDDSPQQETVETQNTCEAYNKDNIDAQIECNEHLKGVRGVR